MDTRCVQRPKRWNMPGVPAATAAERATETIDRAYNRQRIQLAGINLDQHPHLNHYQAFYNMGMPPPSHQEMADVIISLLQT